MIERLLERKKAEVSFPERNPAVSANLELADRGVVENQMPSFQQQHKYDLRLRVGVEFVANDLQLQGREKQAIKQLKFSIYKDIIEDVYEALNLCDDSQVRETLGRILTKIGA